MLTRIFHRWERQLASVSKDRVVRPFEWGTEWIPVNGRGATERDAVHAWVDEVMLDTAGFFRVPDTVSFQFDPAPNDTPALGSAGTVTFASPLATPHAENNVAVARWFPAAGEPDVDRPGSRGRAVVVLPQWNADAQGHVGLSRLLARCGISALRLSLPYHDSRMPPELTRADYIVSSNLARTVQVCRQAVLDARLAVKWLALQGYDRIGILGTSLGSCLALLTTAHEPLIRAQALNHVSPWFADVVWRGLSTRHVRQALDGQIDLDELRTLWRPINPWSHLHRIAHAQSLLVYARYDLTFPVDLSRVIVRAFSDRGLPHEVAALPCGHYSTGVAPFKFMDAYLLIRFLRKYL